MRDSLCSVVVCVFTMSATQSINTVLRPTVLYHYHHITSTMSPPLPAPHHLLLQMAERLLRAQPDPIANHVTDRSIGDRHA